MTCPVVSVVRAGRPEGKIEALPKLKSKSSAKKRFKITGTGKVLRAQAGKSRRMTRRTNKQIRDKRGMVVMEAADAKVVRKYYLP